MKAKIIPRADYEVYFIAAVKKRPGRKEVRNTLKSMHPLFSNSTVYSSEPCVVAGNRCEMITVFAHPRTIADVIFARLRRTRTQTQTLVDRFAPKSPCTVKAPGELLVLGEKPESIRLPALGEEKDERFRTDYEVTEIIDDKKALFDFFARGTPILAIAAAIPVAFAIACASFGQGRERDQIRNETGLTAATTQSSDPAVSVRVRERRDFFACLKEDVETVNSCGGVIVSWRYDAEKQTRVSMKIAGGNFAVLGEKLKRLDNVSDISVPAVSFSKGYPEYEVSFLRAAGQETQNVSIDLSKTQNLETAFAKAGIKIERIKLAPNAECALNMEPPVLSACISLLRNFCDQESLEVKTCAVDSGSTFSVRVSFSHRTVTRASEGPNAESLGKAFFRPEKHGASTETHIHPVVGKISANGTKTVTFRKNAKGEISDEGGFE